ncbi:MAG: biotin synthase BioB [Thermodesulfobacteriota bacterium]
MVELLERLTKKTLCGEPVTTAEAVELISIADDRIFVLLAYSERVRRHFKGTAVNLCSIVNAKSGICAEDCSFCTQSTHYETGVKTHSMKPASFIVDAAKEAERAGAGEFSIVTSGTGVSGAEDVAVLTEALKTMKSETEMERCASLGITDEAVLKKLKEAGLESYHHNLETARSFFPNICTTHSYEDDVNTIKKAKELGFYVCSGGVFGLGESVEQRVELAETLRELEVDSVPINFLDPRPGTPLENAELLSPRECLKIIAMLRFMMPETDLVVCGGRVRALRDLTPLIFAAGANGMMVGDYLTTPGRDIDDDMRMLSDLGLTPTK